MIGGKPVLRFNLCFQQFTGKLLKINVLIVENKEVLKFDVYIGLEAEMHQAYFVYKLTSTETSKEYIGVTSSPTRRMKEHKRKARYGSPSAIHCAMRKYGPNTFQMTVLFGSHDRDYIFNEMEAIFIKENNTLFPHGYNLTPGGEGGNDTEMHSTRMKEMWASKSPEEMAAFKEKMQSVGADISEETRRKRSEAAKAQHADPTKHALAKAALKKTYQDPEKRRAIAERAKARWADPEFRAKMQAKYNTPEQREKKSKAAQTRWAAANS